jgi:hypothetical protein
MNAVDVVVLRNLWGLLAFAAGIVLFVTSLEYKR